MGTRRIKEGDGIQMSSRRAHGEGTYYYREELDVWRWRGYYTDSITGEKKKKELSAKSKKELKVKVEKWQAELKAGKSSRIKMSDWTRIWLDEVIANSVKPATLANYRVSVINHFNPAFGQIYIDKLTTHAIQLYINKIAVNHSPRTVTTIRTHLISCLNSAVNYGYISYNPATATRTPRSERIEKSILTTEEVNLILAKAKSGEYEGASTETEAGRYLVKCHYMLILTAALTGMRQGECLGLQRSKLDLVNNKIRVDTNLSYVRGRGTKLDTTKTAYSVRNVDIPHFLAAELKKWIEYQTKFEQKYNCIFENKHNMLFTNTRGNWLSCTNFMHRVWPAILKAAGITRRVVFHDLRHYHASILLEKNVNIKVISERLGHSNTSVTLNVYSHLIGKTLQKEAISALDNLNLGKGADLK
ncbi:MAG: site-specific integrase [Schwartzia succinivorans]|nr:site-specific integrase [Schwartzia succinivorans]